MSVTRHEEAPWVSALLECPDDFDEFNVWAFDRRWGDGLPLVPPTPTRVKRMLNGTDVDPTKVIVDVPPRMFSATVEKIAINAVMAGCRPSAMPVLLAAAEALGDAALNASAGQATTHPCGLMLLVGGPIAAHAEVYGGAGLFGPDFVGNVTIGRAMRLILQNLGGAWPGESDRSTQGSSAKLSFCFAENEADSPWEPYRVSRGFSASDSTVSLVFAEAPHNLNDHVSKEPRGLGFVFAQTIASVGKNNPYAAASDYVVVVGPEHARIFANHGWGRNDLQEYLHERARIPYREWKIGGMAGLFPMPKYVEAADDDLMLRITSSPSDVHIVVGGGAGLHSAWIPTFGLTRTVTRVIRRADGSAWRRPAT